MNINRWVTRKDSNWQTLNRLLLQAEKKGLKSLSADEIKQMASLYRSVTADFAKAKTNKLGKNLTQKLQSLTSRGYSQIYQGNRRQEWQGVKEFYTWGFPQVFRETAIYTAIATAIFFIPALIGWWYGWHDPAFLDLTVPQSLIHKVRDQGELWMGSILGNQPVASTGIMTNNLGVSFKAIAGGATAGIFTIIIMAYNGLHIGTIGALVTKYGLGYPFWAFVAPHGSLELPAIFLAGGAGLLIGKAMVFPGKYSRIDALKINGRKAAQLTFGIIPLMIIAGVIEGFFSPSLAVPSAFKYIVGAIIFGLLCLYLGKKKPSEVEIT